MGSKFHFSGVCLTISLLILLLASGCEPYQKVTIDNQTSSPLKVDVRNVSLDYSGTPKFSWKTQVEIIQPGLSQKYIAMISKDRSIGIKNKYTVMAIDETNKVLFFKIFTWNELHDMDWRVVISP
jgi:hypothetical protein